MRQAIGVATCTIAVLLGGCAAPGQPVAGRPAPVAERGAAQPLKSSERIAPTADGGQQAAPAAGEPPEGRPGPRREPDAVVMLDPASGALTRAAEARLARVADEAKQDARVIVRLESYVPGGGSPALDIGLAFNSMRRVRDHLQELGVLPRRILLANFGSEYERQRDPQRHWVEVYVLRPEPVAGETQGGSQRK